MSKIPYRPYHPSKTTRQTLQKHLHKRGSQTSHLKRILLIQNKTYTIDGESHNNEVWQKKDTNKFTAVFNRP